MPPKKKARKLTISTSTDKPSVQVDEKNLFHKIGPDLHRYVLSFLLVADATEKLWWCDKKLISKDTSSFLKVSKVWNTLTLETVNCEAPKEILSPHDLALIKSRARKLDLTLISKNFIKDIKEKWGEKCFYVEEDIEIDGTMVHQGNCLDLIVYYYFGKSYEEFANSVCKSYREFLVVKCVELLAAKKNVNESEDEGSVIVKTFKEKCMPYKLLDVFWHTHMLAPKKYAQDCAFLIGETIDHEAAYVSAGEYENSDFESKTKFLFPFELEMMCRNFNQRLDRIPALCGADFEVSHTANNVLGNIYEEMMSDCDCG